MSRSLRSALALPVALSLAALLVAAASGPSAPPPARPAADEPPRYVLDPVHASVVFKVRHLDVSNFYGTFDAIEAELVFDEDDLQGSVIAVSIDAASVDSNNGRRDGHLKSPDFLNAAEFPEITFVSTSIERTGPDAYAVTGQLGFRGMTQEVTAAAVKTGAVSTPRGDLLGLQATLSVDMTAFRVPFVEQNGESAVGRSVELTIAGEFAKQ